MTQLPFCIFIAASDVCLCFILWNFLHAKNPLTTAYHKTNMQKWLNFSSHLIIITIRSCLIFEMVHLWSFEHVKTQFVEVAEEDPKGSKCRLSRKQTSLDAQKTKDEPSQR